ncbi:MAG TPA: hypothetical protein VMU64_03940 [Acidimicrobiales bacterium]|nr:hypothetical protein [Acidimicrobiales bacterium]
MTGTPPSSASAAGPIAARTITISGTGSTCPMSSTAGGFGAGRGGGGGFGGGGAGGFGGGGFGGGGFGGGGGTFSLASASGKVTTASNSVVTVNGIGRIVGSSGTSSVGTDSAPAKVEIATTSSTTFTKVESATSTAVVVGRCVTVLGSKAPSGTLTATSVSIRAAGANGCGGFGGRGGGGFGGGGTSGGSSSV